MKNKMKIFFIMLAMTSLVYSKENTVDKIEKFNSNLVVQGKDITERIDYTLYPQNITLIPNGATNEEIEKIKEKNKNELFPKQSFNYKTNTIENGLHNGKTDAKLAIYAEDGATIHNIGKILSYDQKINTNYGGVLITGIDNPLKRNDNLIGLKGDIDSFVSFINDGQIEMGATEHVLAVPVNIAGLIPTSITFADYGKYIINAAFSDIKNNGTITNGIDSTKYIKAVDVGVLNGGRIDTDRRAVNLEQGSVENTGLINLERIKQFELIDGVAVDLLQIGVHFYRDDYGINILNESTLGKSKNSINSGKIFIGGDIYSQGYSGIGVSALGADFIGEHNKYGINSKNSTFINTGTIEVERDFAKALDDNNNIVDLYLFYKNFLKLGLLSFTNLTETSIGVNINGGEFYNNGGTISVGVNESKNMATQLRKGRAIAVAGENGANIYFNTNIENKNPILSTDKEEIKSTINLEGIHVYATWLEGGSTATFNGLTEINFNMPPIALPDNATEEQKEEYRQAVADYESRRNKEIFHTEDTSKVVINGTIRANGNFDVNPKNNNIELGEKHVQRPIYDKFGNKIGVELEIIPGKLNSTGKIGLNGELKVDTTNFVGMSGKDIEKYFGHKYVEADGGITGNGNLVSSSYLFEIKTDKTNNSISLTDVNRKNFNTIVENKELGKILEDSYEGVSGEKLDFYKYISLGDSYESFSERLNEITGIDNITTLEAQVVDITKDLNRQYKGFIKNNKEEGVVFSYLNSKSEIGEQGKYSGFERESNGFMSGYNKYVLDNLRVGAGLSYMKSSIDYTDESSNKIETWNARAYSDYKIKDINLLSDISLGYNQSENKRFGGDNLHSGDVNIYTLGFNNSLYKNYNITDRFSVNPSINLDFTYYYQDDYKEDNGKFSVNGDKTNGYYGTLGTAVDLKYDIFASGNNKISLVGGMEYSYDILSSTEDIDLENIIGKFSEEKRELDKNSLVYNLGVEYTYNDDYSVGLKYSKEIVNDVDNEKIGLDFTYKF